MLPVQSRYEINAQIISEQASYIHMREFRDPRVDQPQQPWFILSHELTGELIAVYHARL